MAKKLQIKRGARASMPTLAQGELGMTIDSGSEGLFVGTGTENIEMAKKSDLDDVCDTFIATYETTTNAEIYAAHQAGKSVLCKKDSTLFSSTMITSSNAYFTACYDRQIMNVRCVNGHWYYGSNDLLDVVPATIPMGWMRGDINHDGKIDATDLALLYSGVGSAGVTYWSTSFSTQFPDGNVPYDYLAADINGNGIINTVDSTELNVYPKGGKYGEVTGNWTINPNYETEDAQFYRDFTDARFKTTSDVAIFLPSSCMNTQYSFQLNDGYIRMYVVSPPTSDGNCVFLVSTGTGVVSVLDDKTGDDNSVVEGNQLLISKATWRQTYPNEDVSFDVLVSDAEGTYTETFHVDHFVATVNEVPKLIGYGLLGGKYEGENLYIKLTYDRPDYTVKTLWDGVEYFAESPTNIFLTRPLKDGLGNTVIASLNSTVRAYGEKGHVLGFIDDGTLGDMEVTPASIGAAPAVKSVAISLVANGWDNSAKTQTVSVTGVLADETKQFITPTPAIVSQTVYYEAGILCTGQAADSLTFTCLTVPTEDLTVYVVIQEVTQG